MPALTLFLASLSLRHAHSFAVAQNPLALGALAETNAITSVKNRLSMTPVTHGANTTSSEIVFTLSLSDLNVKETAQ